MNLFEEGGNDGDRGTTQVVQADISKFFQDLLQGIGGPTTRSRTKRMKEALQGLIMDVNDNETALERSKSAFEMSKTC